MENLKIVSPWVNYFREIEAMFGDDPKYEFGSYLSHTNKKDLEKLKRISDLDYCSHIIFRLFENLNVDLDNPNRFRLEIMMSPGSSDDPRSANKNHLIDVSKRIILNEKLNQTQMKEFLNVILV